MTRPWNENSPKLTKEKLYAEMQKVVDENVESYKDDFKYDMEAINDRPENRWWGVWVVRRLGTQFKSFTNSIFPMEYVEAVFGSMSGIEKCYFVDFKGGEYSLTEIEMDDEPGKENSAVKEIRKRYKHRMVYEITVYATERYSMEVRRVRGCFDNTFKAEEVAEQLKKDNHGKSVSVECVSPREL